jgi:hypothetical protein
MLSKHNTRLMQIFILVIFGTTLGCETIHGVSSWQDRFPKIADKSCLDKAVRNTPGIEYLDSKTDSDLAKSFWHEKDVRTQTYTVRYKIRGIERTDNTASVSIVERDSEDSSASYNFIHYSNDFGRVNGHPYSKGELKVAHESLAAVNSSVRAMCRLPDFNPKFSE